MNLEIALDKEKISILLKKNRKLVDKIILKEKYDLSDVLLKELNNIIKRNKVSKNWIKSVSVKSNLPDSYTSARIAKSIAKSFVFAKKST